MAGEMYAVSGKTLTDIANAIRSKTGSDDFMTVDNMATQISNIKNDGGSSSDPIDPVVVYNSTRPSDWLPMPTPADNEIYILFHIPDGVSSLLAFTVTCTGRYTVALGSVSDGVFVQISSTTVASGSKYQAELFANDYGNLTSSGMKQVMVKVSGTNIKTWKPNTHTKKTSPSSFMSWNIVEIACRLPSGQSVTCGSTNAKSALNKMRYFTWYGKNLVTSISNMFYNCYSLTSIPQLDTSAVTNMSNMFGYCYSLTSIPQLNTSAVTNMSSMFNNCYSLTTITLDNTVTGWSGYAISLSNCSLSHTAIVKFFNSLPTITSAKAITLTRNPGVSELTDAEKAIATERGWTLTL